MATVYVGLYTENNNTILHLTTTAETYSENFFKYNMSYPATYDRKLANILNTKELSPDRHYIWTARGRINKVIFENFTLFAGLQDYPFQTFSSLKNIEIKGEFKINCSNETNGTNLNLWELFGKINNKFTISGLEKMRFVNIPSNKNHLNLDNFFFKSGITEFDFSVFNNIFEEDNNKSIKTIGLQGMFENCYYLETIDFSKLTKDFREKVTTIHSMFKGCANLKFIFDKSNYFSDNFSIFENCTTGSSGTFGGCTNIYSKKFYNPQRGGAVDGSANNQHYFVCSDDIYAIGTSNSTYYLTTEKKLVLLSSLNNFTLGPDGKYEWEDLKPQIRSIDFSCYYSIDITNLFNGCTSLESCDLKPLFYNIDRFGANGTLKGPVYITAKGLLNNNSSVETFSLKNITDDLNKNYVINLGDNAFNNCTKLKDINLEDIHVTELDVKNCSSLKKITFCQLDIINVNNCSSLKTLQVDKPCYLKYLPDIEATIGRCPNLCGGILKNGTKTKYESGQFYDGFDDFDLTWGEWYDKNLTFAEIDELDYVRTNMTSKCLNRLGLTVNSINSKEILVSDLNNKYYIDINPFMKFVTIDLDKYMTISGTMLDSMVEAIKYVINSCELETININSFNNIKNWLDNINLVSELKRRKKDFVPVILPYKNKPKKNDKHYFIRRDEIEPFFKNVKDKFDIKNNFKGFEIAKYIIESIRNKKLISYESSLKMDFKGIRFPSLPSARRLEIDDGNSIVLPELAILITLNFSNIFLDNPHINGLNNIKLFDGSSLELFLYINELTKSKITFDDGCLENKYEWYNEYPTDIYKNTTKSEIYVVIDLNNYDFSDTSILEIILDEGIDVQFGKNNKLKFNGDITEDLIIGYLENDLVTAETTILIPEGACEINSYEGFTTAKEEFQTTNEHFNVY